MRDLQRKIVILYTTYLGTVPFFTFCLFLIIVGIAAAFIPKLVFLVLVINFISQTTIQLLNLPALQL